MQNHEKSYFTSYGYLKKSFKKSKKNSVYFLKHYASRSAKDDIDFKNSAGMKHPNVPLQLSDLCTRIGTEV